MKTHSFGPIGLTRWGTFGSWSIRVWSTVYEVHRAAPGRRLPTNGRRWWISRRQWTDRKRRGA
jgi:hypothetical protein